MTRENDLRKPQRKTANPDIVVIHHHPYLKCQLSVKIHYPLLVDPEVRRRFFTILIEAYSNVQSAVTTSNLGPFYFTLLFYYYVCRMKHMVDQLRQKMRK